MGPPGCSLPESDCEWPRLPVKSRLPKFHKTALISNLLFNTGTLLGLGAGVGAVALPQPLGLGVGPSDPLTQAMTVGFVVASGLRAASAYRAVLGLQCPSVAHLNMLRSGRRSGASDEKHGPRLGGARDMALA